MDRDHPGDAAAYPRVMKEAFILVEMAMT